MQKISKNRLIEIILLCIIICIFFFVNFIIDKNYEDHEKRNYNYYFSQISLNDNRFDVNGWCFIEGENCPTLESRNKMAIVLKSIDEQEFSIEVPVQFFQRPDITQKYGNGVFDYSYCGFFGGIDNGVDTNKTYRLLIQYDTNVKKYIYTSIYLVNGEVKYQQG